VETWASRGAAIAVAAGGAALSEALRQELAAVADRSHADADQVVLGCGRPLLIAPPQPPRLLVGTVMVCWKETPEAARSLAAAMPLLVNARRVVLAGAEERGASLAAGLADLSCQLAWHGINAEVDFLSSLAGPVRKVLLTAVRSHNADLLVMGAYGHSRTRQIVFGGFTQSVLESAEIAVLLMH
jgi:nucleotide-binding universal stress UspA family protein